MKGSSNSLRSIRGDLSALGMGSFEIGGETNTQLQRDRWTFYRIGVGYQFDQVAIQPSIDLGEHGASYCGMGVCFQGLEVFEKSADLNTVFRYDLKQRRWEGVALKLTLSP
jgi:hypothetical protein